MAEKTGRDKETLVLFDSLLQEAHDRGASPELFIACIRAQWSPIERGPGKTALLISNQTLAEGIGVGLNTVKKYARAGMPRHSRGDSSSGRGTPDMYDVFSCLDWIHKQALSRLEVDEDMAGANSPNLERYRKAKALEQERKNKVADGILIERAVVAQRLADVARIFREGASALERTYGGPVGDDLRRLTDEVLAAAQKAVEPEGSE